MKKKAVEETDVDNLPNTTIALLKKMFQKVFPLVEEELFRWEKQAENIPNEELRKQALASIQAKKFHCQGGAVFSLLAGHHQADAIRFIVAYQTISDYLDNLCDRSTSQDPQDFAMLHEAMHDALQPGNELQDYYMYREDQDDGGYLADLVVTCQQELAALNNYGVIKNSLLELEVLYADLQIHKHVKEEERLPRLQAWYKENMDKALGFTWFEFAAAAGSTLGIFCLVSYAYTEKIHEVLVENIMKGYFPYVQGLHILLDYYIDQQEDEEEGDLNFCSYYRDDVQMLERFQYFFLLAEEHVRELPDAHFHRYIPKGLVALYLSDEKVKKLTQTEQLRKTLLKQSGFTGRWIHYNIRAYNRLVEGE